MTSRLWRPFIREAIAATIVGASILVVLSAAPKFARAAAPVKGTGAGSRLVDALNLLERSASGAQLLKLAEHTWNLKTAEDLASHGIVRTGVASHTDAVLTRRFNPLTGTESRDREVTVYLRADQNLDELVLDLAHELTHATTRPSWDPYDPTLTPARYMQTAIEGPGGEVEAVMMECQVARELVEITGATDTARTRCKDYWTSPGTAVAANGAKSAPETNPNFPGTGIDRNAILKDFYRVGRWKASLDHDLGDDMKRFPLMDASAPRLYSSTGNAPYPIALLHEYSEITEIACENSRRRLEAGTDRAPASGSRVATGRFLASRCH